MQSESGRALGIGQIECLTQPFNPADPLKRAADLQRYASRTETFAMFGDAQPVEITPKQSTLCLSGGKSTEK
jgi:hypothetical protein